MSINVCNDRSMASITSLPSGVSGSSLVLISEQTASSSANISFTSGIDSTYKEYQVHFIDVHPATNNVEFQVNFRDGSTAYDATKTTTFFETIHNEDDNDTSLTYRTGEDLAQGTGIQYLGRSTGNGNDQGIVGILNIFDPSNTTFVKHFTAVTQSLGHTNDYSRNHYIAGYCNTTSAIDGIQFSFSSCNIDAGTFKLYGIS